MLFEWLTPLMVWLGLPSIGCLLLFFILLVIIFKD